MDYLTKIPGVPTKDSALPGMAFFSGSGPAGQTCGDCQHRKLHRRASRCSMFKTLTGRYGPTIQKRYACCKYSEALA